MNRMEAELAMKSGSRVQHTLFGADEWMEQRPTDGRYIFEDGCSCESEEFWHYRQGPEWNSGWRITE